MAAHLVLIPPPGDVDDDSMKSCKSSEEFAPVPKNPSKYNWLTDENIAQLDKCKPSESLSADSQVDQEEMLSALSQCIKCGSVWDNAYQLHQAINYLGDMYGFHCSASGKKIFCTCGLSHKREK